MAPRMTIDHRLLRLVSAGSLLFAICAACTYSEGERAESGACPEGEVCSDATPAGLVFYGALPGDDAEGLEFLRSVAMGGTQRLSIGTGGDTELGAVDIVSSAPWFLTVDPIDDPEIGDLGVELAGLAEGDAYVRVLARGSDELYDRVLIRVARVASADVTLSSHPEDDLRAAYKIVDKQKRYEAVDAAKEIGLPVILKASAGGGGRGMKIVRDLEKLPAMVETAQAEAQAAFGDGSIYVERYVESPRHIEVQVVADQHGNVVDLLERECSVQRRHQKVVEEAPAASLPEDVRTRIRAAAVTAAKAIGYYSVGTIEFLLDGDDFYFMEMNTRIQVEHCVTEMITGVDLVQEQIRLATGEPLAHLDREHRARGHAIECRINAEDPVKFTPQPGTITALNFPGGYGVRVDSHVYHGYRVSAHYDSMLAKLIAYAPTRERAIARMRRALGELVVEGIRTNTALHRWIMRHPAFISGRYDTHFLEANLDPAAILAVAEDQN